MALNKTLVSSSGLIANNAYIKIDSYNCNKDNIVTAILRAYKNQEAEREGKTYIEGTEKFITLTVDYSDGAQNAKKQIYDFVKTLEEFKDALDA